MQRGRAYLALGSRRLKCSLGVGVFLERHERRPVGMTQPSIVDDVLDLWVVEGSASMRLRRRSGMVSTRYLSARWSDLDIVSLS